MRALARFATRWPRAILAATAVLVVAAGVFGSGVDELLSTGGNEVPGSDSTLAAALLDASGEGPPNVLVLISQQGGLDEPAADIASAVVNLLTERPDTTVQGSAWPGVEGDPLRSVDGTAGLIVAHVAGTDGEVQRRAGEIADELRSRPTPTGVTLEVGGSGPARADLIDTTDRDLIRAELIALPISLLILLFVFRTPFAAAMPLLIAIVAIIGTLGILRGLVAVTEVSVFARSVTTAIGLAMAIDLSLFLVARYREKRLTAPDPATAVTEAIVAAGPSMLFSGLTTAASLAALLAFSTPILRSFAYAGVAVVLLALAGGLVVLPATLTVLGDRLDRWPVRTSRSEATSGGRWRRLAQWVMARPVAVGLITLVGLVVVASPITRIDFGLNDDRVLPSSVESRRVIDVVRQEFPALEAGSISVVFDRPVELADRIAYVDRIEALDRVARVEDRGSWLSVMPAVEPISAEGRALVETLRSTSGPVPVYVGGEPARLVDNTNHVSDRLPAVLLVLVGVTIAMLAVLFRSILVPLKAVVLNLLSLSAMFGAIVWIFQDGRLAGVLGYTPTGLTDVTVPTLMFCVAFGLSMDYEVFLLSRIRENYLLTGDPEAATADGLQRTGGILSASAILMAVVFMSFATASVAHLKVLGIGITLAVLIDAFVVRTLLVPSFMAIAGRANWWPGVRESSAVAARSSRSAATGSLRSPLRPGRRWWRRRRRRRPRRRGWRRRLGGV